jgi:hypothetical protein
MSPDPASEKDFWLNSVSSCACDNKAEFQAQAADVFENGTIVLSPRDEHRHPAGHSSLETVSGVIINSENDTVAKLSYQERVVAADQANGVMGVIDEAYYIDLFDNGIVQRFSSLNAAYFKAGRRERNLDNHVCTIR